MSEGFAQYFAALYAQHQRGDETFAGVLRQLRRWGIEQSDQGPVYLGYRLGHIRSDSRVFRAVDLQQGRRGPAHAAAAGRATRRSSAGSAASIAESRFRKVGTEEFRAAMEAETGRSLERFFERWIYGSTLPRLTFSYRVEPAARRAARR